VKFQAWVLNKIKNKCDAVCFGTHVPALQYNATPQSSERTFSHQKHKYHISASCVAIKTTERWRNMLLFSRYRFGFRSSAILGGIGWIVRYRRFGTAYQSQTQCSNNPKRITSYTYVTNHQMVCYFSTILLSNARVKR